MFDLQACPSDHPTAALPDDPSSLEDALNAAAGVSRILFVPGPGNVFDTWRHWASGRDDPSIPSIGYSHQVYELARRLGAQLIVLSQHPLSADAPVEPDAPVRFLHRPEIVRSGLRYHLGSAMDALGLVRRAAQEGADLIICQKYLDHFWPLALARLLGIKTAISLHNSFWPVHRAPTRRERIIGALNGLAFRFLRSPVICVSSAVRDQAVRICASDTAACVQVPQYSDAARQMWRSRPAGRSAGRMLYLGRITDSKGVFQLLEAFSRLAHAHPGATLRYVGGGGDLEALRAAIRDAGLQARVEASGQVDGAAVFAALRGSDLLVCPTTTRFAEGLAKTPIEAALCGIPSVVSSTVPCGELLGDATRIYRADDVDDLHGTLDGLLGSPDELHRMNIAAKNRREVFFDRRESLASQLLAAIGQDALAPSAPWSLPRLQVRSWLRVGAP
jgi:glycogen(starch) synthase